MHSKTITIIIPYLNSETNVENIIDIIESQQDMSSNIYKCIAVSNSKIFKKVERDCINLHESNHLNSPYSARNLGVSHQKSDYYLFLDATCIPSYNWIEILDKELLADFDLLAANVKFASKNQSERTIGDVYDAIINIDNEASVSNCGVAKTACLIVRSDVFESVGYFESGIRSGGDVIWTKRASDMGYKLKFNKDWIVTKFSRNSKEMLVKQFRVAKAWPNVWKGLSKSKYFSNIVKKVILGFLPPSPRVLYNKAKRRSVSLSIFDKFKLIIFGTVLRIVSSMGILYGMLKRRN